MKIQNGIAYPDGADQTANFRHQTTVDEYGEELYFAPVQVRNDKDLQTFGVTKEAQWTLPFGGSADKIKVLYFMTPNKEMAEDFWMKINTAHSKEYRKRRCLVPGKQKPLIVCPDCNSCAHCPFPEYRDKHEAREICYDDQIKVQKTPSTESPEIRQLEMKWTIQDACKKISEINPLFTRAIVLKAYYNYSVEEIAAELDCSTNMVRYYLRRATEIGKEFRKEYFR